MSSSVANSQSPELVRKTYHSSLVVHPLRPVLSESCLLTTSTTTVLRKCEDFLLLSGSTLSLVATNVDEDDDDEEEEDEEEENEEEGEQVKPEKKAQPENTQGDDLLSPLRLPPESDDDEGCCLLINGKGAAPKTTASWSLDSTGRRSFSASVDSGRSSDMGTLASSNSTNSEGPAATAASSSNSNNKVTVFVPYESHGEDGAVQESMTSKASAAKIRSVGDQVTICDNKVVLQIHCHADAEHDNDDNDEHSDGNDEASAPKKSNSRCSQQRRRMSRRLSTTVAVYELQQEKGAASPAAATTSAPPLQLRRRKDLCKLLGVVECDLSHVEKQHVQKVAFENLLRASQKGSAAEKTASSSSSDLPEAAARKKNLVKFFGVEETPAPPPTAAAASPASGAPSASTSKLGQLLKSSLPLPWKAGGQEMSLECGGASFDYDDDSSERVQLRSFSVMGLETPPPASASSTLHSSVMADDDKHHHRKDLNKFLGMDDSDSEEMVFISNRRRQRPQDSLSGEAQASNSSTTREEVKKAPEGNNSMSLGEAQRTDETKRTAEEAKSAAVSAAKSPRSESKMQNKALFREYDFHVGESIAAGLPIFEAKSAGHTNSSSNSSSSRVRIDKKANRRLKKAGAVSPVSYRLPTCYYALHRVGSPISGGPNVCSSGGGIILETVTTAAAAAARGPRRGRQQQQQPQPSLVPAVGFPAMLASRSAEHLGYYVAAGNPAANRFATAHAK